MSYTLRSPYRLQSLPLQFTKTRNPLHHDKIPNLYEKSLTSSIEPHTLFLRLSNAMLPQIDRKKEKTISQLLTVLNCKKHSISFCMKGDFLFYQITYRETSSFKKFPSQSSSCFFVAYFYRIYLPHQFSVVSCNFI